jgi:hypothetical protein
MWNTNKMEYEWIKNLAFHFKYLNTNPLKGEGYDDIQEEKGIIKYKKLKQATA